MKVLIIISHVLLHVMLHSAFITSIKTYPKNFVYKSDFRVTEIGTKIYSMGYGSPAL